MNYILARDDIRVYEKIMNSSNDLLKQYRASKNSIKKYVDLLHNKMIEALIENPDEKKLDLQWFSEDRRDPSDGIVSDYSDSLEFILQNIYPNSYFRIYALELNETIVYHLEAKINNNDLTNNTEHENAKDNYFKKMKERKTLEDEIKDFEQKLYELRQKQIDINK